MGKSCSNTRFFGRQASLAVRNLPFQSESTGCSSPFCCETWEICEPFSHAPFPFHPVVIPPTVHGVEKDFQDGSALIFHSLHSSVLKIEVSSLDTSNHMVEKPHKTLHQYH